MFLLEDPGANPSQLLEAAGAPWLMAISSTFTAQHPDLTSIATSLFSDFVPLASFYEDPCDHTAPTKIISPSPDLSCPPAKSPLPCKVADSRD